MAKVTAITFTAYTPADRPAAGAGRAATEPRVAISDKGQLRFNVLASKVFGKNTHAVVAFSVEAQALKVRGVTPKNKEQEAKCFKLAEMKGGSKQISLADLLKHRLSYPCEKLGNQAYDGDSIVVDEKESSILITLDAKRKPVPKATRTKATPAPVAPAPAVAGKGKATPAPEADSIDEL